MTATESLEKAAELHRAGRLDEAERIYRRLLEAEPNDARLWHLLGVLAHQRQNYAQAVELIRRAVALDGSQIAFYINLSAANMALGRFDDAVAALAEVVERRPAEPKAHDDLGLLLARLGRWEDAAESFRRAIAVRPDYAPAHNNLGNALNQQGRRAEAAECFRAAIRWQPDLVGAYNNLGNTLKAMGQIDAAIAQYREALRLAPGHAAAEHNLAETLASWNGAPLAGRTLLVRCHYGLGDTLQFVRYVPEVYRRGAGRVLLAAREALHPLLADSGFGELVAPAAEGLAYDVQVSLMDLACLIRLGDEAVPAPPYLRPRAGLAEQWRAALAPHTGLRVGIAWQGDRRYAWDHLRSIPLGYFEPLASVEGVRLVSLQKGDGVEQLESLAGRFAVVDFGERLDREAAFLDTAAIIANLDLVITSDTSIAHLAGGMAAPVWVALAFDCDWRWRAAGDRTRWYPTMRLFRQSRRGDWPDVFTRMRDALAGLVAGGARGRPDHS